MRQGDLFGGGGCAVVARSLLREPEYIASGSNHEGEIKGFASLGMHVGVAANHLSSAAQSALLSLAGSELFVFVDSGAFTEMDFSSGAPKVKEEITHEQWLKRLDLAARLAEGLSSQALVVAPDRIACQATTLQRLQRYADSVRRIARAGATVLMPVQKGALSMAAFFAACCSALPTVELVPAIPCKKDATSPAELRAFARATRPARLHLLGIGPKSGKRFHAMVAAVAEASPACFVTCDSVAIKSAVGRGNGDPAEVRGLTAAQDDVAENIAEDRWAEHRGEEETLDYTEAIGDPTSWMSPAAMRRFASHVVACGFVRRSSEKAIAKDVTAWLQEDDARGYVFQHTLDEEWSRHHFRSTVVERKRRALVAWFGRKAE